MEFPSLIAFSGFRPDTTVLFVYALAAGLANFAERVPGAITEVRRATGTIAPFLDRRVGSVGQQERVAELSRRAAPAPDDAPVVCALDTGVAGHPLVSPSLKALGRTTRLGKRTTTRHGGHGTAVAGLVLYGDFEPHMNRAEPVELRQGIESMKLLPPQGFPANKPPSYGVGTKAPSHRSKSSGRA